MIKIYNHSFHHHTDVGIHNISCEFELGKAYALVGPNGAGKTTLFQSLIGRHYTNGSIVVDGEEIRTNFLKHMSICDVINQGTATVVAPLYFTVLRYIKAFKKLNPDFDAKYAAKYIDLYEIDLFTKFIELSKGKQLLLILVCNMARNVNYYLLDEPFSSIDQIYRDDILRMIIDKISDGKTVIVSSHDLHTINNSFDCYYFLKEGRLVRQTNIDEMINDEIFQIYKNLYSEGELL